MVPDTNHMNGRLTQIEASAMFSAQTNQRKGNDRIPTMDRDNGSNQNGNNEESSSNTRKDLFCNYCQSPMDTQKKKGKMQ